MPRLPRATDVIEAISGELWNAAADELERLSNLQVSPPLELTDGPAGRRLSVRIQPDRLYWGVVQCHGPLGTESDYADNRYWVALGYISNAATDGPTAKVRITAYATADPRYQVVTATNFFENNDATHFVRPETIVRLWAEYDRSTPAQLRWTMIVADEGTALAAACPAGSSSSSPSSSSSSSASSQSASSTSNSGSSSCITVVTGVQCVNGQIQVTTANIQAVLC